MKSNYDPIFGVLFGANYYLEEEPYTLLCTHCKEENNPSDSIFCISCGKKMETSDIEEKQ